jgi:hypothetical protein
MSRFPRAREYAVAFLGFLLLSVGLSWPLARHFSTRMLGDVAYDERHSLWLLWHYKEALLGRQPLFDQTLLFHPRGLSTLIDGVGPVSGLLALPFWPLGGIAAYNGATLLGLALSGWCMYLLVRVASNTNDTRAAGRTTYTNVAVSTNDATSAEDTSDASRVNDRNAASATSTRGGPGPGLLGLPSLDTACAWFAGIAFMVWPIHLIGLYGHIEKVFAGLLPLSVLAGLMAFDPGRRRRWLAAPAIVLLLAAMHNGNQFIFAAMALAIVGICALVTSPRERWLTIAWRGIVAGVLAIVLCGPLLLRISRLLNEPAILTAFSDLSPNYSPDVAQLVVPSIHQATVGRLVYPHYENVTFDFTRESRIPWLNPEQKWQGSGIETAATIPITVLLLIAVALIAGLFAFRSTAFRDTAFNGAASKDAAFEAGAFNGVGYKGVTRAALGAWFAFSACFVVLTLGPFLRMGGRTTFTVFKMPLMLPFAWLASRQGFSLMRTPGRFMMMGSVALALLGAFGLLALRKRLPRHAQAIAIAAIALLLVETWPRVWPQQVPLPVPEFYQKIAQDPEPYAVLDLPEARWDPNFASAYMYFQLTHRKPIAWAYLSRLYVRYPIDAVRAVLNDTGTDPAATAQTRRRLLDLGYRYIVWHKHGAQMFGSRHPDEVRDFHWPEPPLDPQSHPFIRSAFANQRPVADDALVTVYRLDGDAAQR